MDTGYMLFGVLLFVAVVLAIEGTYHLWAAKHSAEAKRIATRLRYLDGMPQAPAISIDRLDSAQQPGRLYSKLLSQLSLLRHLHELATTSGTGRSVGELMLSSTVLAGAALALALLRGWDMPMPLLLSAGCAALPWMWLTQRRNARLKRLELQLPLALDFISRALRAGHTLPLAMKMVGEEMSDPIAREFRQFSDETNFGMSPSDALLRLTQRIPLEDVRYFAVALMIQRESGGNLTEMLDNLAGLVRARLKLMGQVRTFSAEGRMSAWVLGMLPFIAAAMMNATNQELVSVLWTDPTGRRLVGGALLLMLVGAVWMRRIIRIHV